MALLNLAEIKTRLLACGAVLLGGTVAAGALTGTAPLIIAGAGAAGIASSLAGGILSNDLGELVKRLRYNQNLLDSDDLTQAVGLAVALVIYSVAKNPQYSAHKTALETVAKKSVTYWGTIARAAESDPNYTGIEEQHLPALFSANSQDLAKVRALDPETWAHATGWLCNEAGVSLLPDAIHYVAQRLHETFPKALRQVLAHDAAQGGQAFAGMQLSLLGNILDGIKQLKAQNQAIVKGLEAEISRISGMASGIGDGLGQIEDLLQEIWERLGRPLPPVDLNFREIIADKTDGFVGRQFVFAAIENFCQSHPKGYFTIVAQPGAGKSAILAEYVLWNECVAYFNMRSAGITSTGDFLKSVCKQLIDRYDLDYKTPLHPDSMKNGNFLSNLLAEASKKLKPGERLAIAVDALDEVDLNSQNAGANVLYLPEVLPDGVYFILTRRPEDVPFRINPQTRHQLFDLQDYPRESLADIETYIRGVTGRPQLRAWMAERRMAVEEFITKLAAKSEKNFMYLRFVLPEIEGGAYRDLEKIENLPQGLQDYYRDDHWRRMGMEDGRLFEVKINIVYILGEVRKPVSRELLAKLAGESEKTVQKVLTEWEPFLYPEKIEEETRYRIYHSSFRDFLYSQEIVQAPDEKRREINARIAKALMGGLWDDE
jgi:hypothetical protein